LAAVLAQPKVNKLLSSDHFSVDGTLIEGLRAATLFVGPPVAGEHRQHCSISPAWQAK